MSVTTDETEKAGKLTEFLKSKDFESIPLNSRVNYIHKYLAISKLPFNDSLSLYYLLKSAYFNIEMGEFDAAFILLDSIHNSTSKNVFPSIYFKTLSLKGYSYKRLGDNEKTLFYMQKIIDEARKTNNLNAEFIGHMDMGDYFKKISQPEKSLPHYYEADEIAELQNDFVKLDRTKAKIGRTLKLAGEYTSAMSYFLKSLEYAKKTNNVNRIDEMELDIIKYSKDLSPKEKIIRSEPYVHKFELTGFTKELSDIYDWLAKLYYRIGSPEKSRVYSIKAIEFGKKGKLNKAILLSYTRLGIIEYDKGNYSSAHNYLAKAKQYFIPDEKPEIGTYIYRTISDCYFAQGKYKLAAEAMSKAYQFQKLSNKIDTRKKLAIKFIKYSLDKEKQKQIEIEKARGEVKIAKRNYVIYSLIGISFTIFVVLFYTFKFLRIEKNNLIIQKQKSDLIEKQKSELNRLNSMKNKFFSVLAHDLRGPVGNMRRLSQLTLMMSQKENNKEKIEVASLLYSSSKNIQNLLKSLLLWGKVQMKNIEPNKVEYFISKRIGEITKLYQEIISSKKINIIINIDETHTLCADADMLDAVFRNIIYNALKYSKDSGTVIIASRSVLNNIEVTVQDDGIGIDDDKINFLYSEEWRSNSATEMNKNSGLGLILAYEFINIQGGEMKIESELNVGTKIIITLPEYNKRGNAIKPSPGIG